MKRLPITLIAVSVLTVGCENTTTMSNSSGDTPVSVTWSSLTLTEQQAIMKVSKHYNDAKPKVVRIEETKTVNPPHALMFLVKLSGHFSEGVNSADALQFSLLGDGTKAWAITSSSPLIYDDELSLK